MTWIFDRSGSTLVERLSRAASAVDSAIFWAYNRYFRPHLPRRVTEFNGVTVRAQYWFDSVSPWAASPSSPSTYETEIMSSIRSHVEPGDDVVVVGGGWGVTATEAAKHVGETGQVFSYEASARHAEYVTETARLNDVADIITSKHAVVAECYESLSDVGNADVIEPEDLPPCDVLELDCEGAELQILRSLESRPRVIIVESHGHLGSPSDELEDVLVETGYDVVSNEVAERGPWEPVCREKDVRVLTAIDDSR